MPWMETQRVMERMKFIVALDEAPDDKFSTQCKRFGISRQTGYKWVERFETGGAGALEDRRPVAVHHPNATDEAVADALVALRKRYPTWGPKKLRASLAADRPELILPAPSTIGDILKRRGMVAARKRRLRVPPNPANLVTATCPNALWTADHKGDFRLSSGRCYPLTVADSFSRYLLKCEALRSTSVEDARPHLEAAFREYGLPERFRSDNGVPFAQANAPGRLSRLSVWLVKLGIGLELIEPGHPEQNGRHERMHLTLEEAIDEGRCDMAEQQRRFDVFRRIYNHERPHEALEMRTPARVYETSWRPYPAVVRSPEYGADMEVRRVSHSGQMKWRGHSFFLSNVLQDEPVGVRELDEDRWSLHFGPVFLCTLDMRGGEPRLSFRPPRPREAPEPADLPDHELRSEPADHESRGPSGP